MEGVKKLFGAATKPEESSPSNLSASMIGAIRDVNRDWVELGCDAETRSVACANLREAMARLGLPQAPAEAKKAEYAVGLGPAKVVSKPARFVLATDSEKRAACAKRCGVFGSVLASTLATTALSTNALADLGVDSQKELVAQAGGAAAAVASVALCSRLFCDPGRNSKTVDDPNGTYVLKGAYTYVAASKDGVNDFQAYVEDEAQK